MQNRNKWFVTERDGDINEKKDIIDIFSVYNAYFACPASAGKRNK